jgi:hypothetical protein
MKYVIGNNLVTQIATHLLPNVTQLNCGTDYDNWNIGTFYIPYYCLDFVQQILPGAKLSKYTLRTMYDMRNKLSAVKPKNFEQIYKLYTRGKVNVEGEYINDVSETIDTVLINGESSFISLTILHDELKRLNQDKIEYVDISEIDVKQRLIKLKSEKEYLYSRLIYTSDLASLISLDKNRIVERYIEQNYATDETFSLPVVDKYVYRCKLENENDIQISKIFGQIATVGKPWFRKIFYNSTVVYESLKQIFDEKIEGNTVEEYIEETQITDTLGIIKVAGIDLLGKCTEWDNSVGMGHIIRRCNSLLEYYGDDEKNHKIIFPGQENLLY